MTLNSNSYSEEYYERGLISGISGYVNYSWMPELTIRMAHHISNQLDFTREDKILDFGCAKGFLVKALRILDFQAYGADISQYAIQNCDSTVKDYCRLITDPELIFDNKIQFDWILAKDVFEHISEEELNETLLNLRKIGNNLFAAIPLSENDICNKYIVPAYENDITHVIRKSMEWWTLKFQTCGWKIKQSSNSFTGCKENWTKKFPTGNGFYILEKE